MNYLISRTSPRIHKTEAPASVMIDGYLSRGSHRPVCMKRELEFSAVYDSLEGLTSKPCPKCFA